MKKHLLIPLLCAAGIPLQSDAQLVTGPSSTKTPYLIPTVTGGVATSLLTVTDSAANGYRMAGLPDGIGAYDNGNNTFTLLVNHEMGNTVGAVRAHGSTGAFVSKWIINKTTLQVVAGSDLIQNVKLWNPLTSSYITYTPNFPNTTTAFGRFCSGDLPAVSAFYNENNGKGTQARIFMNGEETGAEGRAFGHIATGPEAGSTFELPRLGKLSYENAVARPYSSDTTVVVGLDDATPGQVYFYIGTKTASGTDVERAGLTNGRLFGLSVQGMLTESNGTFAGPNTPFTLVDLGNVQNMSGAALQTASNNNGVTQFLRPEDGAWDPFAPTDFYFLTTNGFNSPSRMWRVRFTNPDNLLLGGTITAVLDGTEGQQMMDNMGIDNSGHILIQEDVGNNVHIGKTWQYTIATDALTPVMRHDSTRFITGQPNFLTQDEEASGAIDAQEILGPGMWLMVDQAHYGMPSPFIEGGQMLTFLNPGTLSSNPEIAVLGNNILITDGDQTPNIVDYSDLGNGNVNGNLTRTFTIQNTGAGPLPIYSIGITGANASEFTITSPLTFPVVVPANGTQTITVKFTPTTTGVRNAVLNINTNDIDETRYDFAIRGTGVVPEINVTGNGLMIADGDQTPGTASNSDFGNVNTGATVTRTFTIESAGQGSLTITGINVSGLNASEFQLVTPPPFPLTITAGNSQTFTIAFTPNAAGLRTANVNILNDDSDEGTYDFKVQGVALSATGIASTTSIESVTLAPNPTRDAATITLKLTKADHVAVSVYDVQGRQATAATESDLSAGNHQMVINTSGLTSGIYFVQVVSRGGTTRIRMEVLR
jgi:hypothetical protein